LINPLSIASITSSYVIILYTSYFYNISIRKRYQKVTKKAFKLKNFKYLLFSTISNHSLRFGKIPNVMLYHPTLLELSLLPMTADISKT
jgi:hypothetical protein